MSVPDPIRVQIFQRDRLARTGLIGSLRLFSDFAVLATDLAADEDWPSARTNCAQVVIADFEAAMELLRAATSPRKALPPIVVVPGPDRERELKQALESSVRGYLVSGFSVDELAESVRAVHRGARFLCPRAASRLAESVYFPPLTEREEAVLELVAQGLCNKSIARQLGIALGTVKSHLKAAFGKLFVASRTQAVFVSERRGLLARRMCFDGPRRNVGDRFSALLHA